MNAKRLPAFVVLAAVVLAAAGFAVAADGHSQTTVVKEATKAFHHDVGAAEAAGYGRFLDAAGIACIESAAGGMGVHYVKGALVGDAVLDPAEPEALVYQPQVDGKLKLVAVEYIVFKSAWENAGHLGRPSLFGREFDFTDAPNRYGIPPFYALHAWIFKGNPAGHLEPYNPQVDC